MQKLICKLDIIIRNIWCDWLTFGLIIKLFLNHWRLIYVINLLWIILFLF